MGNDPMTALGLKMGIKCADPECGMAGCAGAQVARAIEEARRKERAACARAVEQRVRTWKADQGLRGVPWEGDSLVRAITRGIRARGKRRRDG